MTITPGLRLGPYLIVSAAGAGGMGEVWRAKDTRLDREVAIKFLPAEFANNAQLRTRFDLEARAISAFSHPHICTLFDVGSMTNEGDSQPISYLVMELLDGETLASRLLRGALPLADVLRYGQQIASALDAAHRKGITHRDLKPGNVMITRSGAKLLDFGLARTAAEASPISGLGDAPTARLPITAEGTIVGTLQYVAPEQVEGLPADARTDIFAFGALLYEMLTGQRAFQGTSKTSLIAAIVSSEPPAASELVPMTPPALEHVIRKCLAKDPDGRWQSAADIAGQLQWISETAISRSGEIAAARRSEPKLRRALPWLAAIALLIAGVVAGRWLGGSAESSSPQLQATIALPAGTQLAGWGSPAIAISPDATTIAFIASRDGKQQLYLRGLNEPDARAVEGSDGAEGPFFSPDGRWIGFGAGAISARSTEPRTLKKASVAGGPAQTVASIADYFGGSWSEDGFIYFSSAPSDSLWRVTSAGGEPAQVKVERSQPRSMVWPQILPGGRTALVTITGGRDRELALLDVTTGAVDLLKIDAVFGRVAGGSRLLYVKSDGSLFAAPFTTEDGATGPAALIASNIALTANGAGAFAVAENGTAIYAEGYVQGSGRELRVPARVDMSGKPTLMGFEPDTVSLMSLSPDSTRLAVTTWEKDLFIYDLERRTRMKVKRGESLGRAGALWSADGSSIVFNSETAEAMHLMMQSADGADEPRMLLELESGEAWASSFSPDGEWLAYHVVGSTPQQVSWEVWLMPTDTPAEVRKLAVGYAPRISPDGRWIAWESDESGRWEIHLQAFPGGGRELVVSTNGGRSAMWSSDGTRLFYWQGDDLMAVSVDSTPVLRVGTPTQLFNGASFELPPARRTWAITTVDDGFIVLAPAPGQQAQTHLSFHTTWLAEVDRKLSAARE